MMLKLDLHISNLDNGQKAIICDYKYKHPKLSAIDIAGQPQKEFKLLIHLDCTTINWV